MNEKIKGGIKTSLIILAIYILFVIYLLFVSDRVERLDNRIKEEKTYYSIKIDD